LLQVDGSVFQYWPTARSCGNLASSYLVLKSGSFAFDQEIPVTLGHAQPTQRLP
jgi:hypothetical protein